MCTNSIIRSSAPARIKERCRAEATALHFGEGVRKEELICLVSGIKEAGDDAETGIFGGVEFEGGAVENFSVLNDGFDLSCVADVFGGVPGDDQKRGAAAGLYAAPFVFRFHKSCGVVS